MNYNEIILAVIGLLSTIITCVVVPYLKTKMTETQQKDLAQTVKIVVSAVEQLANSGVIMKKDKREVAILKLEELGIDIKDERIFREVSMLIEAFVSEMNGNIDRIM